MWRTSLLSLLSLALAPAADALTVQIDSVTLLAGNTPDSPSNASVAEVLVASDSVPDVSGGPFAEVGARWAGTLFADGANAAADASWRIEFTVQADPGVVYDVVIFQELIGAFSFFDDSAAGATGRVGELTGTLDGLPNPLLSMPAGVDGQASSTTTTSVPFQRSRLLELDNLTGTRSFALEFAFALEAESLGDQVAVQLGLPGAIDAAQYPGVGARDAAGDGHFLSLQSRVVFAVPEPSTLPLTALGLIALGRRRCRR